MEMFERKKESTCYWGKSRTSKKQNNLALFQSESCINKKSTQHTEETSYSIVKEF